jgi:hypothetical protein
MEMQEDALQLNDKLRTGQPDTYAGMRLDMDNGVVHVRSTRPTEARAAAGALSFGTLKFVKADKAAEPVVKVPTAKVKAEGKAKAPAVEQDFCGPLNCQTPLRSGVRLDGERDTDADYKWGGCTLGYVVQMPGGPDQKYLLTAGHCFYDSSDPAGNHNRKEERVWHNGIEVGQEGTGDGSYGHSAHGNHSGDDPHGPSNEYTWLTPDYAMIPVQNQDFWFGQTADRKPGLLAAYGDCDNKTQEGYDCQIDDVLAITGTASHPPAGTAVCQQGTAEEGNTGTHAESGWRPGQRCGEVIANQDETMNGKRVITNFCTAPGDSGGPLYIAHKDDTASAIGILTDGSPNLSGYENCAETVDGPSAAKGKKASWYWTVDHIILDELAHGNRFRLYTR